MDKQKQQQSQNQEPEEKQQLLSTFDKIYGAGEGVRIFFAPGRVNLIGEHTDYNGGHVFPCALTMGTYLAVRKRTDHCLNFYTLNWPELGVISGDLSELAYAPQARWANYPMGVIWALGMRGYRVTAGMDVLVYGNIPNGSGLSSSASLEVAMGLAARELFGFADLSLLKLAQICQYAENKFNGCNCGLMDQFASALGKAGHALFADMNSLNYQYVPVDLPGYELIITNSNVKHALVDSAYNDRRAESEAALKDLQAELNIKGLGDVDEETLGRYEMLIKDPVSRKRARHAVSENQRTIAAVAALNAGELEAFGALMNASHRSLRDDYQVSCPEIDLLVELAWQRPGVVGSRITGGGFGGCTVSIVSQEAVPAFIEEIGRAYQKETGRQAVFYRAEIGDGAREL